MLKILSIQTELEDLIRARFTTEKHQPAKPALDKGKKSVALDANAVFFEPDKTNKSFSSNCFYRRASI